MADFNEVVSDGVGLTEAKSVSLAITYPTLSTPPDKDGYRRAPLYDSTIRSRTEDGLVITRPRHTRSAWQWWFQYTGLPSADLALLDTFQEAVQIGSNAFYWTDPVSEVEYLCKLAEPIQAEGATENTPTNFWNVAVHLFEAVGAVP
jgi:hypothetical protein